MTIERAKELLAINKNTHKYISWEIAPNIKCKEKIEIYLYYQNGRHGLYCINVDDFNLMTEEKFISLVIPATKDKDELAGELMTKLLDREEKFQEVTKLDREIKELTQEMLRRR